MNRKNPFLEDYEEERRKNEPYQRQSAHQTVYSSPSAQLGNVSASKPSNSAHASDEKERLRRQYEINDRLMNDLPPSYDEIAPAAKHAKPSGDVKVRTSSNSSNGRPTSQSRMNNRERSGSHHKSSKKEHSSGSRKSKKPAIAKNVDTIDKLDVTGLFGGAFHHDGPFDACTPHRNKDKKAAPVLAFPKDGPNSSLAGKINPSSGYQSKMNQVFGISNDYGMTSTNGIDDDDDDHVYSMDSSKMTTRGRKGEFISVQQNNISTDTLPSNRSSTTLAAVKNNTSLQQFNTNERVRIHGPVSQGLGSTTFLDGAPAAREVEERQQKIQRSLSRKKSVSHRLGLKHDPAEYTSASISKIKSDGVDIEKPKSSGSKLLRRVKTLGRRT